jgi:hypothetical protein
MENCDTEANHYDLQLLVALLHGRMRVTCDLCQRHFEMLQDRADLPSFTAVVTLPS